MADELMRDRGSRVLATYVIASLLHASFSHYFCFIFLSLLRTLIWRLLVHLSIRSFYNDNLYNILLLVLLF